MVSVVLFQLIIFCAVQSAVQSVLQHWMNRNHVPIYLQRASAHQQTPLSHSATLSVNPTTVSQLRFTRNAILPSLLWNLSPLLILLRVKYVLWLYSTAAVHISWSVPISSTLAVNVLYLHSWRASIDWSRWRWYASLLKSALDSPINTSASFWLPHFKWDCLNTCVLDFVP